MKDFFISYNKADKQWAEWIAWTLEEAGYETVIQAWDFRVGNDFVVEMDEADRTTVQTIAVLSPSYLNGQFTKAEWTAAFARDPTGAKRTLIPLRVKPCEPDGLLQARVYADLVGCPESEARAKLYGAVKDGKVRPKPDRKPMFPGGLPRVEFPGQPLKELNRNSPQVVRPLLPYKADRVGQYEALRDAILSMQSRKPLVCLIYGEKKQGQDKFLELAREECYPKAFKYRGTDNLLTIQPILPKEGFASYQEFSKNYIANIAETVPPYFYTFDSEIVNQSFDEIFRTGTKAIAIESAILLKHWEYHDMNILKYCLRFWDEWAKQYSLSGNLLVCLHTEFVERSPQSIVEKITNKCFGRANLCLRDNLTFPKFDSLCFKVIPKLNSIDREDVNRWRTQIVEREFGPRISRKIKTASEEIFTGRNRNQVIFMDDFSSRMNDILLM